ncbi:MAG: carboxypeptidase regulatory-like domain-containing protein [Sphingobacteriales bacterium]|nr:carboxypeptidase regulatory-like domain-containing protein [Sphingobacteriales bacterium]
MNARQESKLNMYRALTQYCDKNAALIATVPAFSNALNTLKTKIAAIQSNASKESAQIGGIAQDKTAAKEILCTRTAEIAAAVYAYAHQTNNNTLRQKMNFSVSDLLRIKDDLLVPTCQVIYNQAQANLPNLADYALNAAALTTLQNAMNNYTNATPLVRNAIGNRSTFRINIKNLLKETDDLLKNQLDKISLQFKNTNPDFLLTYRQLRIIIDPTRTTTGIKIELKNNQTLLPVPNATISIAELNINATTGAGGIAHIKPVPHGNYTLLISAPGYQNAQSAVKVIQGKSNPLALQLQILQ